MDLFAAKSQEKKTFFLFIVACLLIRFLFTQWRSNFSHSLTFPPSPSLSLLIHSPALSFYSAFVALPHGSSFTTSLWEFCMAWMRAEWENYYRETHTTWKFSIKMIFFSSSLVRFAATRFGVFAHVQVHYELNAIFLIFFCVPISSSVCWTAATQFNSL